MKNGTASFFSIYIAFFVHIYKIFFYRQTALECEMRLEFCDSNFLEMYRFLGMVRISPSANVGRLLHRPPNLWSNFCVKATARVFIMISPVDRESKLPRGDVISIPHVCFCRPGTFLIKVAVLFYYY